MLAKLLAERDAIRKHRPATGGRSEPHRFGIPRVARKSDAGEAAGRPATRPDILVGVGGVRIAIAPILLGGLRPELKPRRHAPPRREARVGLREIDLILGEHRTIARARVDKIAKVGEITSGGLGELPVLFRRRSADDRELEPRQRVRGDIHRATPDHGFVLIRRDRVVQRSVDDQAASGKLKLRRERARARDLVRVIGGERDGAAAVRDAEIRQAIAQHGRAVRGGDGHAAVVEESVIPVIHRAEREHQRGRGLEVHGERRREALGEFGLLHETIARKNIRPCVRRRRRRVVVRGHPLLQRILIGLADVQDHAEAVAEKDVGILEDAAGPEFARLRITRPVARAETEAIGVGHEIGLPTDAPALPLEGALALQIDRARGSVGIHLRAAGEVHLDPIDAVDRHLVEAERTRPASEALRPIAARHLETVHTHADVLRVHAAQAGAA